MSAQSKDPERSRHNAQIIRRHLKGEQPADIARRLGIPAARVNRELTLARKRWQEGRTVGLAEAAESQRDIDEMEDVFLRAWAKHGLPGATPMRTRDESATFAERQDNVDSLETAAQCIRRRSRLRAVQRPGASQSETLDPIDDLSEEEVDRDLARIAYELKLRGTKAPA